MPAGTKFLIEEGALGVQLKNVSVENPQGYDYFCFDLKNTQLHAVHPLGWIRRLILRVDGEEIPQDRFFFVLRGQWIRADHLPDIVDIFWYLCEPAQIYVRRDGGLQAGVHRVACTFFASRLEETLILDTRGIWPLREQTVEQDMTLAEG